MSLCGGVSEWFSSYDYPLAPLQRETKTMNNLEKQAPEWLWYVILAGFLLSIYLLLHI